MVSRNFRSSSELRDSASASAEKRDALEKLKISRSAWFLEAYKGGKGGDLKMFTRVSDWGANETEV